MKNKNRPFFYEKKKPSFRKILLTAIIIFALLSYGGLQIPTVRQVIAEPLFAAGSLVVNTAKVFFASTRMLHEEESPRQKYDPLELPDSQVLFAEDLESLAIVSQEDPLADLRMTPTPSEYSRVAEWEYLDPNLNYEISSGGKPVEDNTLVQMLPPVFERADLFNDGPAILSAALRFWGKAEHQYAIAAEIHPDWVDPSTVLSQLQSYVGTAWPDLMTLIRINGDKDTLTGLLIREIPVILPIQTRSLFQYWPEDDRFSAKYLLITGYSSESDCFFYQDTQNGNSLKIGSDELLAAWYPFQRSYLLIYPEAKDEAVREALAENYFEALNLQKADAKFRTDSENLPQNPFAQYNYGAVLHQSGDENGAWACFQRAVELGLPQRFLNYRTDILETALNLGYADDMDALIDPVLARNSHDEVLIVYRGWARILRGENRAGAEQFDRAGKINPGNDFVVYALKYKETMLQF